MPACGYEFYLRVFNYSNSTLRAQPPVVFSLTEEENWRLCLNRVNPLK